MGKMYNFIVDYVRHEKFEVMEIPSQLTNAPLYQRVSAGETEKYSLDVSKGD
jgi:hypothetical protein